MYYFSLNYDFRNQVVPSDIRKVTLRSVVRLLWVADEAILEMPEPLWLRFLPRGAIIAATWKLGGLVRGRRRELVTYAMENNELERLLAGRGRAPRFAVVLFGAIIGAYIGAAFNRIAFASPSAKTTYLSLPFTDRVNSAQFLELPSPAVLDPEPEPLSAIFVGALEARKGISPLMNAWEAVEEQFPAAVLHVAGAGALAPDVARWAAVRPDQRRFHDHLRRQDVQALVRRTAVLVAPSVPDGRWREQIGLPIKEALANGLTVVTTDQTGLQTWLAARGHFIVPADSLTEQLAQAVQTALREPIPREEVLDSLPHRDGRYEADEWLHRPDTRG
jgi:glycosyltransferase involved in cell wall biosynthesis